MATVVQTTTVNRVSGISSSPGMQLGINATPGNSLVVVVCSTRLSTASGNLVDAVTSTPASTWTPAGASTWTTAGGHRVAINIFIAAAVTGGATDVALDLTYETGTTNVSWFVSEVSGLVSFAALDRTAIANVTDAASSITVGPTSTLSSASQFILAIAASRFWWNYNGGAVAPSGYTTLASNIVDDGLGTTFQASFRNVSATTALSATWTVPTGSDGGLALISTFRNSTSVVRCTFVDGTPPDDITGVTGITAYVWEGDPADSLPTKYTGLAAESTGNTLLIPAPGWAAVNDTVTVIAYSASGGASPLMLGTVE